MPVDLGATAAVTDIGVNGIGKVDRRAAVGKLDDIALRRENVDMILKQLDLDGFHELGSVFDVLIPVDEVAQP